MEWKKRGLYDTVVAAVTTMSGQSEEELVNPTPVVPETIENLKTAADAIRSALANGDNISIMGDYDADGITSSAILYFLLKKLDEEAEPYVRLPRRMSEGYGLNVNTVAEFEPGLLITVDNGIAAIEAVAEAKKRGLFVVVLDHHLPQDVLPDADVIVDPHINPEANGFEDYCGAGLAYKLAQLMLPEDDDFLKEMVALAAIGTVADGMPLVGDNRVIVKEGLQVMGGSSQLVPGLRALMQVADITQPDEHVIGFNIGPMLNAAGRIDDNGAQKAYQTLIADGMAMGTILATELKDMNELRKEYVNEAMERVEDTIAEECLYSDAPLVVFVPEIPEGVVGILTGRIAEKYKVPAFVFSNSAEAPDIYKGSGRSYGDVHLLETIKDAMPLMIAGGGHAGAAGVTVHADNFDEMVRRMQAALADYEAPEANVIEYDLKINADDIAKYHEELKKYAPYGQGNPAPVFFIEDAVLAPQAGKVMRYMGKSEEHVKLHGKNYSAVCFGLAEEYQRMGEPRCLDFIGTIGENNFRGNVQRQVEVIEFRRHEKAKNGSSLLDAMRASGII